MPRQRDINARFGMSLARRITARIGLPPTGDSQPNAASRDRCRGAMIGLAVGESLYRTLRNREAAIGADPQMTLITADSVLADPAEHPARFAGRLMAVRQRGAGEATRVTQQSLRAGKPWWDVATANSAGCAAAARATGFGLLWADNPEWAAYEASLSATVTHGHGAAIAGAAAIAAGVALAASGRGPLDADWLEKTAEIVAEYREEPVYGKTVAGQIRRLPAMLGSPPWEALGELGGDALVTEAVPAALYLAATATAPIRPALFGRHGRWPANTIVRLHNAICAMAGACVGARHGQGAWPGQQDPLRLGGAGKVTQIRGMEDIVVAADRIAGRRVQSVPQPPGAEDSGGAAAGEESADERRGEANPVHVSFLIDRSGSMRGLEGEVVRGFNDFVAEQREGEGDCALTLVQFDSEDPQEVVFAETALAEVPELTQDRYQPRGGTPLLDALGTLIEGAQLRLKKLDHDEDQIVVIFTDGHENASRKWTRATLFDRIAELKRAAWVFVFLGSNQDSYAEAGRLGIGRGSAKNFRSSSGGWKGAFKSVGQSVRDYRGAAPRERKVRKEEFFRKRGEGEE